MTTAELIDTRANYVADAYVSGHPEELSDWEVNLLQFDTTFQSLVEEASGRVGRSARAASQSLVGDYAHLDA